MGLFSLFKKGKPDAAATDSDADAARLAANSEVQRAAANSQLQRDIARATALKIDAIEAAMEADIFNTPEPAAPKRPPRPAAPPPSDNPATLPLLDASTTELLADDEIPAPLADSAAAPVVEESAILYANGQASVAEQMLAAALAEAAAAGLGAQQDRTVWWLLFDLYQAQGQQARFDSLSIDYASTFETSPPPWRGADSGPDSGPNRGPDRGPSSPATSGEPGAGDAGLAPAQLFGAVLDASAGAILACINASGSAAPVRLDFSAIRSADAEGCALLLTALHSLQKQGRALTVVAAAELAALLQAQLTVGDRAAGAAPWLLLLELLQLLNREADFEEASMDYCVTFEVSPPPFVAPSKVATALSAAVPAAPAAVLAADRFMLPAVVEDSCSALLDAINSHAAQYPALIFDCSRLARLEFGAANQLLSRLQALAADGRRVEFREVNHLVAALLRLLGYAGVARIIAHKY